MPRTHHTSGTRRARTTNSHSLRHTQDATQSNTTQSNDKRNLTDHIFSKQKRRQSAEMIDGPPRSAPRTTNAKQKGGQKQIGSNYMWATDSAPPRGPRLARGYGVAASVTHISAFEPHPLAIGGLRRCELGFDYASAYTMAGARGDARSVWVHCASCRVHLVAS